MEEYDDFKNINNKKLVWDMLIDNKIFDGIENNLFNNVQNIFEQHILYISKTGKSLADKNKILIKNMIEEIKLIRMNSIKTNQLVSQNISKPLEEVNLENDKNLKIKQDEFIKLIQKPTQAEINFSDNNDRPFDINNMNRMINEMREQREKELNQISPPLEKKNDNNSNKINIEDNKSKSVLFNINNNNNNNNNEEEEEDKFLSKLINKGEELKNIENDEKIENLEKIEKIENLRNIEKIEKIENLRNIEKIENLEKINNLGNINNLENLNIEDKVNNLERKIELIINNQKEILNILSKK